MIIALSKLLNISVRFVYPVVSGTRSAPFKSLNYLFKPPFSDPEKGVLTITWTNTVPPQKNSITSRPRPGSLWSPNHFVPLVDVPKTEEYVPTHAEVHIPVQTSEPIERSASFQSTNRFSIFIEDEDQSSKTHKSRPSKKRKASIDEEPEIEQTTAVKKEATRTKVRGTKPGKKGTASLKKDTTRTKARAKKSQKEPVHITPEKTTLIDDNMEVTDTEEVNTNDEHSNLSTILEEPEPIDDMDITDENEANDNDEQIDLLAIFEELDTVEEPEITNEPDD